MTLETPRVLTEGLPNLDFTLAPDSTCTGQVTAGSTCKVNVNFIPRYPGGRRGGVQIVNASGTVLATTFIYGIGNGPQLEFDPNTESAVPGTTAALYSKPVVDTADNLYVIDYTSNQVLKIPADGSTSTPIGTGLQNPLFIALDGAGDVFIADSLRVVEVPFGGGPQVTLPFNFGVSGFPGDLAVDGAGNVFVVQEGSTIISELPAGSKTQIDHNIAPFGDVDPFNIAADIAGNVYFDLDQELGELPANGGPIIPVYQETGINKELDDFNIDRVGNVFIVNRVDHDSSSLLQLPVAQGFPAINPAPILIQGIQATDPRGVAVDDGGNLFFPLTDNGPINPDGPSFAQFQRTQLSPVDFGTIAVNSVQTTPLNIFNGGNTPLVLNPRLESSDFQLLSASPEFCLDGVAPGQSCLLTIQFSPASLGAKTASLTLDNNGYSNPVVTLQGTATGTAAPMFSLPSGVYPTEQTVSITSGTPGTVIYYTTNGNAPTASSTLYSEPVPVASSQTLEAIAIVPGAPLAIAKSQIATASYMIATGASSNPLNFGEGFAAASSLLQLNGTTTRNGSNLRLTAGEKNSVGSVFYATPLPVNAFSTAFTFQLTNPATDGQPYDIRKLYPPADGLTFTIQNTGVRALGGGGSSLGYAGIGKSVAIKFDPYNNAGEGPDSTGIFADGKTPTVPAVDLRPSGVDLHSSHPMLAQITYSGTILTLSLTDTASLANFTQSFPIDIPSTVGAGTAYIGFTAASGAKTATQQILSWTYLAGVPEPLPLPPAVASVPSYPNGFNPVGLVTNGSASLAGYSLTSYDEPYEYEPPSTLLPNPLGSTLQLTDGSDTYFVDIGRPFLYELPLNSAPGLYEAASAYYAKPLNIQKFTTDFSFLQIGVGNDAHHTGDGMTFVIQNVGPNALGADAAALGYAPVGKSVAIKFDLHNNKGEGFNSTGIYTDGAMPTVPALDLTPSGIELGGGLFFVHLTYDSANLNMSITDTRRESTTYLHSFSIDIPAAVGGNTAYVGFSGSTGGYSSTQQILTWTFTNP